MRLIFFLLTVVCLQVSATGTAQTVTFTGRNVSLQKVLKEVEMQTGYVFLYASPVLENTKPVTIDAKQLPLRQFLDKVLQRQSIKYLIRSNSIILSRNKERTTGDTPAIPGDNKESPLVSLIHVKGQVMDVNRHPLAAATITVKASGRATIADEAGMFSLNNIEADAILVISSMGYTSRELHAREDMGIITMQASVSRLDEVQVVGYGTTTRRLTTGSVSKVSSEEIAHSPVSNPIQALEGRMSGVYIAENSGVAGASFNIVIQGQNTINAGKLPLYIIDGVPFDGSAVEQAVGSYVSPPSLIGSSGFNPLNSLSPESIESIEVLKDADATAIYGSRAANGVVVITTKKGKAGKSRIQADVYTGISNAARTLPMLNASQYISMREKAFANDGITPTATNAPDLTLFPDGGDINFQDYFMNTGHFTNATLELSGGDQYTQFLLSGSLRHETPVFSGNFVDNKTQVRFNIRHTSTDNRFSLNASGAYTVDNNNIPFFNLYSVYNLPPNLPLYDSTGKLAWYTGYNNPVSGLINPVNQHNVDLLGNLSLSYRIAAGLSFKADMGYHTTTVDNTEAVLIASKNPASSAVGVVYKTNSARKLYTIEPQLNYTVAMGKGKLQALAGGTYQYNSDDKPYFLLGTFTSDNLYEDIGSLNIILKTSGYSERKYASFFGRLNYVWDNKYIINGNFRRDGSSAFAPGRRYGNFGSIGAAWIFSEEKGVQKMLPWLSFGKLHASYGSIGNDQIPVYGYLSYYSSSSNYAGDATLSPSKPVNDDNYSWELTKKFDVAVDLGFVHDRILFTASWFRNITNNMLLNIPIGSQVGFSSYTGNVPGAKVENKGIELELNTTNIHTPAFSWKTSFNFTAPKNKLLAFPHLASSSFATGGLYSTGTNPGYAIGQSLNMLFGYKFTGFKDGVATVQDMDEDGMITPGLYPNGKGDWVPLGTSDPRFYGGLSNNFSYKGVQLDILFQFVKKDNYNIFHASSKAPGSNANQPADILDIPVSYSTLAGSAAAAAFVNYYALSDATVSDASYLRLKNVSLSYSLPDAWTKPLKLYNTMVYCRAQNLLTITHYKGFDPENFGATLPLYRMITVGIKTSL